MKNGTTGSAQTTPESKLKVFELQAEVGITKHVGSLRATQELMELCHIDGNTHVLDVGCGVGLTPSYLAKTIGCRVVGVDVSPKMIQRSKEKAVREKTEGLTDFKVADAQDLPFEDGLFDAVISESVVSMVEDNERALSEYSRVTKPGGYIGLNEAIWFREPPPELIAHIGQTSGITINVLTARDWEALLESAGLTDLVVRTYEVEVRSEASGMLRRLGLGDLLRSSYRALRLYATSPAYRAWAKEASSEPKEMAEYMGYGLFVGRKQRS
jgi:arsenite methyltransferase